MFCRAGDHDSQVVFERETGKPHELAIKETPHLKGEPSKPILSKWCLFPSFSTKNHKVVQRKTMNWFLVDKNFTPDRLNTLGAQVMWGSHTWSMWMLRMTCSYFFCFSWHVLFIPLPSCVFGKICELVDLFFFVHFFLFKQKRFRGFCFHYFTITVHLFCISSNLLFKWREPRVFPSGKLDYLHHETKEFDHVGANECRTEGGNVPLQWGRTRAPK